MKKIFLNASIALFGLVLFASCSPSEEAAESSGLTKIRLQTDWYAQAEHGGFYQAIAEGYYEEAGLDVTIIPGGPNDMGVQKIATGRVEFSIRRVDDLVVQASNGVPILIVGTLMQHDPQALLVHEEGGVDSFKDLDGRTVMTTPGAAMVRYLEKRYGITIETIPVDYGMNRFLADKKFIQQCFITNEPYYIRKQGANPKTLLISDSGYDPYRVIYTSKSFARNNSDTVKAFVAASIRGWQSYMKGPREGANALISQSNPKMTEEFMAFSVDAMRENRLVSGNGDVDQTGLIDPERMQGLIDDLFELGIIENRVTSSEIAPSTFLPEYLQAMIGTD